MKTFFVHLLGIILLIGLIIKYPDIMINPGDLSIGHQDLKTKCFSCHTPFKGIRIEKCLACHELKKIGVTTVEGKPITTPNTVKPFHDVLLKIDCMTCHTDHRGVEAKRNFIYFSHNLLMMDVKSNCYSCHKYKLPDDFIHKQVGNDCSSCHSTTRWQIERFDHSLLKTIVGARCSFCHKKSKPGDVLHQGIRMDCRECHTTTYWKPSTFEHDRYFRFDRRHPPRCESCHQNLADFKRYTCYSCHEHSYRKIAAEHQEEGIWNFKNCIDCHRNGQEAEGKRNWKKIKRGRSNFMNLEYGDHKEDEND